MRPTHTIAALGAAVLVMAASPALAGAPAPTATTTSLTATPNPVMLSQTTQLKATIVPSAAVVCSGSVDMATAGGILLCGNVSIVPDGGYFAASCNLTGAAIGPVGPVSVIATYTPTGGICAGSPPSPTTVTVAAEPTAVPTVGEWTLWGLMGLMMMGGAAMLVRRTRRLSLPHQ